MGRDKEKRTEVMRDDPLFYVVVAACLAVLGILLLGIGGFAKGGDFNRKYANKIMRWRIGAQLGAVVLILLFVWLRRQG
jgi:preprotein translocase subunit SecF